MASGEEKGLAIMEKIMDGARRLDMIINLTIVNFAQAALQLFITKEDIIIFTLVAAVFFQGPTLYCNKGSYLSELSKILSGPTHLILTRVVISYMEPLDKGSTMPISLILYFVNSCTVIAAISLFPDSYIQSIEGQKFSRLVLFMWADSLEILVNIARVNSIVPFVALICLVALDDIKNWFEHRQSSTKEQKTKQHVLGYFLTALRFALMNMFLNNTMETNVSASEAVLQVIKLVSIIIVLDHIKRDISELSDIRDFAVWKGATSIFYIASRFDFPALLLAFSTLVGTALWHVAMWSSTGSSAIIDIGAVIATNGVLDYVMQVLQTLDPKDFILIFVVFMVVIHYILHKMNNKL